MILGIVFQQSGYAQTITDIPPTVSFPEWVEAEADNEAVQEFNIAFPSAFTSQIEPNDTVNLRVFLPKERQEPIPVVVILHYWGAADQKIERSLAGDLVREGIGAVLMPLPYHLSRTPKGERSGARAIRPDPATMIETLTQGTLDVRRTLDFIESRPEFDKTRIGVAGTSLGSIVASLAYALDGRLAHGAFMLGGADLAHIFWHSSRVVEVRESLRRRGFTESRLRDALTSVEPLTYLPNRKAGTAFVIGGKFDTVMPPSDTQKLISSLTSVQSLWLDTGHYGGVFVQRRILRLVSQFFSARFTSKEFVPPKSVYAPTVRILVEANFESSFQVGVGLDIWRANARGDVFASAIATPKGPQLYFGGRLDKSLSIGVFATPRRISPGIMWSIVL